MSAVLCRSRPHHHRTTPISRIEVDKMMTGSRFLACSLLIITQIAAVFPQTQFSDDCHPTAIHDISATLGLQIPTPPYPGVNSSSPEVNEFPESVMITARLNLGTHRGTHIVSPGHALKYYGNSPTVDNLNLATLNGPVLVVDVPSNGNITAEVLRSLSLPAGLKRVIFKTCNTKRNLIGSPNLTTDYAGLTPDAATWLVQNTTIEFIGIDYVSVGVYEERATVYENLFAKPEIVTAEFLKLDEIKPGPYTVYCLPIKLEAVAAPARCILVE